jgi:hypothetical protein
MFWGDNKVMKPLIMDGIKYNKQYVDGLRQPLLAVRDCLIEQNQLLFAMPLSEIHAILKYYIEQVEE